MSTKKNFVILSAVLLFSILIISSVSAGTSGVTSIWTTDVSCGTTSQDVNSYSVGEHVFINGQGNSLTGSEAWSIVGTPGSCDPGITVASGTISDGWSSGSTTFCFDSYTVQVGDCGVYKVNVEGKKDNYNQVVVGNGDIICTDSDGDGYYAEGGDCGVVDCDDNDATIYPGAIEIPADGIDQDCDGYELCYVDADNDGYRPDSMSTVISNDLDCTDSGEAQSSDPIGDCNDNDASVYPGATEICNSIDDDCDGQVDEGCVCETGDTQTCDTGNEGICAAGTQTCGDSVWGECVQDNSATEEICDNQLDDDCDGLVDEGCDNTAVCGNGVIESGEECDSGNSINGIECSPLYGSSCNYCSTSCTTETITGPYCGDTVCDAQYNENWLTCNADCAIPDSAPTCSVDYLKGVYGEGTYYFSDSIYINQIGHYEVYGSSQTNNEECKMDVVQYNRTSPNPYYVPSWKTSSKQTSDWSLWKTDVNDALFIEGWHEVCCLPTSQECDGNSCGEYIQGPSNCEKFCIDTTDPLQVTGVYHSNPSDCVSNYINVAPEFSWNTVVDTGCAPIIYEVELHLSNGTYVDTYEVSETTFTVPSEELVNGQDYYVLVRAKDLAGNSGVWSVASTHVWYDIEDPTVAITGQPWNVWYNSNFNVIETDSDNLGLYTCKYRILDGTTVTKDWTSISCGVDVSLLVDVSLYCETDGQDSCKVEKEVVDKACNVGTTYQTWDLDRQAPTTSKEVVTPKISPFGTWIDLLRNGFFVKETTRITLSCEDQTDLSGCANTYYTIEFTPFNEDGTYGTKVLIGTYTDSSPFTLNNGDGLYEITYWSVDNAGNVEVSKFEVDKVDLYAPKTTMSFTGLVIQGLNYNSENFAFNVVMNFIKPSCDEEPTIIELAATDSEVGVDKTYYQILVPTTGEGIHNEWYGTDTDMWYESEGACLNENDNCEITSWALSTQFNGMLNNDSLDCGEIPGWCEYNESQGVVFSEECDHKICYYSVDRLGNTEEVECTVFSVDGTGPDVTIWNPYEWLSGSIKSCGINLEITALDEKSGIENGEVTGIDYILKDSKGTVLDGGPLDYIGDNTYGLINRNIDLEGLPSGNYVLSVTATDRLGNPTTVSRDIYLEPGIFIDEDTINGCSVGLEGGICDITFDVCVRNVSSMTFAMSKIDTVLSGQISANQLNAMLFVNDNSGKVGQLNEISEGVYEGYEDTRLPEEVDFISQCQIVNGIESFTVSLNFPEGILKSNSGNYNFDYEVKGYNCEQEGFIEPDETPAD